MQNLSTRSSNISGSSSKVKGVPYLNPDPYCQFIGPKNWSEALTDEELMTCLLDNGSQLNFITPVYARKWGMDIMSLDSLAQEVGGKLPPILGIGGIMVDPEGFVMMNVKVPCVKGYNEDQIAIIMDDPGMKDCPVILGMPTIFRVMKVIKESEIPKLAIPWASSRVSWLMRGVHAQMSQLTVDDVANKSMAPLSVEEVVQVSHKCKIPPFSHKVIHGSVGLVLQGYRMNVMTHGLEKRLPLRNMSEHIDLSPEALEAFDYLKAACLQAPILTFLDFDKTFPFGNGRLSERPTSCSVSETGRWAVSSHHLCQPCNE